MQKEEVPYFIFGSSTRCFFKVVNSLGGSGQKIHQEAYYVEETISIEEWKDNID